ncbi:MAG: Lrp/AsnC family transcriptional regulator [Candidatus Bilamarchaeaceae archaeon]
MEKLKAKDFEIIYALDFYARDNINALAKKLKMNKDVFNYRLKRLEKLGVIQGYYFIPDTTKTGMMSYKIVLKYQSITNEIESDLLQYLLSIKEVGWIAKTEGTYDLMIIVWFKNEVDFGDFFNTFLSKYGQYLYMRDIIFITENHALRRDYLITKFPIMKRDEVFYKGAPKNLCDETDFKILDFLQQNVRASNVEISQYIGLTPEAVRYRIKELVNKGVILTFRPRINLQKIGYSYYNVMISLKDVNITPKIYRYALSNPNITYYVKYLGKYDVGLDIEVQSHTRLRQILGEIRSLFGKYIINYDSVQIYDELKITY